MPFWGVVVEGFGGLEATFFDSGYLISKFSG